MKAVLRGKLIALSASKKKLERANTNSLTEHLKALKQKEANTAKRTRQQEIIETKRTIKRINKTRSWFFEKINEIDKPLARLTRGHRDSTQINKIRNEERDITMKYIFKIIFYLEILLIIFLTVLEMSIFLMFTFNVFLLF